MTGSEFLSLATNGTLGLLTLAFAITTIRIAIGPTLPDRILALDMLVSIGVGYIAVIAVKTGFTLYLDIAIALSLVGFLSTVAFARYVLQTRVNESTKQQPDEAEKTGKAES
jgi:multicomponent Na+:H+ antiporter subunit F